MENVKLEYSIPPELTKAIQKTIRQAFFQLQEEGNNSRLSKLNKQQACEYLGISNPSMNKLIKEGKVHPTKVGRRYIFSRTDLDRLTFGN